jgi:glycosyltransferase involved in cell wall biosynthesis
LFQASDIVVIPGRSRGTPYQLLAAWSAKKPVVATYEGSFGLIDHEKNGFQVHDNPNSFIWGIERILYDWDHAHSVANNGWRSIQKDFTWNAVAKKVERLYTTLVSG